MSFRGISVLSAMIAYYKWKAHCLRPLSACVHIFIFDRESERERAQMWVSDGNVAGCGSGMKAETGQLLCRWLWWKCLQVRLQYQLCLIRFCSFHFILIIVTRLAQTWLPRPVTRVSFLNVALIAFKLAVSNISKVDRDNSLNNSSEGEFSVRLG